MHVLGKGNYCAPMEYDSGTKQVFFGQSLCTIKDLCRIYIFRETTPVKD